MSTKNKMIKAAAGWAASQGGAVAPEGVDFDGSLDRLRNVYGSSGKYYITMSFWFYSPGETQEIYSRVMTNGQDNIRLYQVGDTFYADFFNSNFGQQHAATKSFRAASNTWNHIVFSGSFTASGNAIQFYLNDQSQGNLLLTYDALASTEQEYVAQSNNQKGNVRLSHMYIRDSVTDLSVVANRRNFITEDLKPAEDQGSYANPRVYLPMLDADTAIVNEGTGANFTANGVLATSQRGPNQYNCVASNFDGLADYVYRTANITGTNPTKISFSATFKPNVLSGGNRKLFIISDVNDLQPRVTVQISGGRLFVTFLDYARANFVTIQNNTNLTIGKQHHLCCSFDLDTQTYRARWDNKDISGSVVVIGPITSFGLVQITPRITIGAWKREGGQPDSGFWGGRIGEFYLDTNYVDLSVDNPFWDAGADRPKPVRQVLDETGNTPLLALPIEANNAGLNLGTGGDFTVNSAPFTGARGGSEYWARSAHFDGSTGYLSNTGVGGSTNSQVASFVFAAKLDTGMINDRLIKVGNWDFYWGTDERLNMLINGTTDFYATDVLPKTGVGDWLTYNKWGLILFSIDFSTQTYNLYDGTGNVASAVIGTSPRAGGSNGTFGSCDISTASNPFDGMYGHMYLIDSYIDFSQEANRLKFVDAFGYPIDLQPAIDAGDIPNPLVYMKFDDPSNLGINSGTGGDFTVNGTVTAGADVDPNA